MAEKTQVELELVALTKQAQADVKKFASESQKQLSSISMATNFSAFINGFQAVAGVARTTFNAVAGVVSKAIDQSLEAEKANVKLANSMRLVGGFSVQAFQSMTDFADALARTSEASDDEVVSSLALAKSFQLTNQEAKNVVKAATELSAITGQSLNSSVETLAKTYNNFVSRELKQLIPSLRSATEEQLRHGFAVEKVNAQFDGTAAKLNESFGGALNQVGKGTNEILEAFGDMFTKSEDARRGIQALADAEYALAAAIKETDLDGFVDNLLDIGFAITNPIAGITQLGAAVATHFGKASLAMLGFGEAEKQAVDETKALSEELKRQQRLGQASKSGGENESQIIAQRALNAEREKIENEWTSQKKSILLDSLNETQRINREFIDKEKLIRKAFNFGYISSEKEKNNLIEGLEIQRIKKLDDAHKASVAKIAAENAKFATNGAGELSGAFVKGTKVSNQQGAAAGASIVGNILKGAEGAKSIFQSIASGIGEALIPGFGPIIGEIVGVLAQGPDKVREMIREFAKAVPDIIQAIVESIPVVIEEMAKAMPQIISTLIDRVPEIINALVKQMPQVALALALEMPNIAIAFAEGLIQNMPKIVAGFVRGLIEGAGKFLQALVDGIKQFLGLGGNDKGGVGGFLGGIPVVGGLLSGAADVIGGAVGAVGDFLGFADGGRTPDNPKYRGDRGLVRIGPDEQTFSKDLTNRMEKYLNENEGGGGRVMQLTAVVQVGQQQLASTMFELDRRGFRTRTA